MDLIVLPALFPLKGVFWKMKFVCSNCRFKFEVVDAQVCPRCTSKRIERVLEKKEEAVEGGKPGALGASKPFIYSHRVLGESKDSWKSFYSQEMTVCPECGGKEFEFNWKHKEKICKKCGTIINLPRRGA